MWKQYPVQNKRTIKTPPGLLACKRRSRHWKGPQWLARHQSATAAGAVLIGRCQSKPAFVSVLQTTFSSIPSQPIPCVITPATTSAQGPTGEGRVGCRGL